MDVRQQTILQLVIETYIRDAEPVGSKSLSCCEGVDVSPATIRNDMAELEGNGFLRQPHTSAGRVPTEKGYAFYLSHMVNAAPERTLIEHLVRLIQSISDAELAVKLLAKNIVERSGETVIVAFDPKWSYFTGVANLFQKPEFARAADAHTLSEVVDAFDEVVAELFGTLGNELAVLLGSQNPFGSDMGSILARCRLPGGEQEGVLALIGPMRMDYRKNISLMNAAQEALKEYV